MKATLKKRVAVIITTVLLLSLFLTSVVFAESTYKNLKAWFGDIKIFSNNQQVQLDVKPFIVDGTTYVPLRALSNIFNKNISWDGTNLKISINDKPNQDATNMAYLTQQIVEKQNKINELEAKVAQLEAELATTKKSTKYDLDDMEDYLNDEYGKYEKIGFDIELSGKKNDIEVEIYVDLDDYYSKWKALTTSKIEKLIQYIVNDIQENFKDADIEGYIEDSSEDEELVEFYLNARGKLVVDIKDGSYTYDLDELEDYLNRYYNKYEGIYFDIELSGDEDDISIYVTADKDDLDYLTEREIEYYLEDLYNEIIHEFSDAYVDGTIEDDYTEYEFDFDSKGNVDLY